MNCICWNRSWSIKSMESEESPRIPFCRYVSISYNYLVWKYFIDTTTNSFTTAAVSRRCAGDHDSGNSWTDLTGSQDGSVSLWEWGHQTAVATPRQPGTFAKVTRVRFSQHGNKFGVADSDGHLSLFQVACREGTARPFFVRILLRFLPPNAIPQRYISFSNRSFRITSAIARWRLTLSSLGHVA